MSGWKRRALGEICQVLGGGTPRRSNPTYFGGTIPWATPSDVTALPGLIISTTRETITDEGLRSSSAKRVPAGAVLLTTRATIGYTAVAAVPMATNQGFANLICGPDVLPDFLAIYLRSQRSSLIRLAGTTTFPEVSKTALKQFLVPVPPLSEQTRIVDILTRANGIRRLRLEAREKMRQLVPALFMDMFGDPVANPKGWRLTRLRHVIEGFQGGRNLKSDGDRGSMSRFCILKVSAVTSGEYRPDESKPAPPEYVPPVDHIVRVGDLLITRANTVDLVGAVALVEHTPPDVLLPDKIWRFIWRVPSPVVPLFVKELLGHPSVRREMGKLATGTSDSMRNISQGRLLEMVVPVPPLALQTKFADRSEVLRSVMAQQTIMVNEVNALVASLMDQAFNGASLSRRDRRP